MNSYDGSSKSEKTETKPCEKCGTPVTLFDRRVYGKKGLCDSCWLIHMSERREIFARYEKLFMEYLAGLGIHAKGTDTYGLEESGQPSDYSSEEDRDHDMIRLRQSEYAVGAFHIDNGWIAIPECGSGLRYITPASSAKLMTMMASASETVLAAATFEKHVYILDDDGKITSNDNEVNGRICFGKAFRGRAGEGCQRIYDRRHSAGRFQYLL